MATKNDYHTMKLKPDVGRFGPLKSWLDWVQTCHKDDIKVGLTALVDGRAVKWWLEDHPTNALDLEERARAKAATVDAPFEWAQEVPAPVFFQKVLHYIGDMMCRRATYRHHMLGLIAKVRCN